METEFITAKVVYSATELDAIREEFSLKQIDLEELKEEKAMVAKGYSERIKNAEKIQKESRTIIKNGFEFKEVECEVNFNYAERVVEYASVKTAEIVHTRKMTPKEYQYRIDRVPNANLGNQASASA